MARTIFLYYTNCKDPSREKELSDWYDNIHCPDVEAILGFTSCIRYKLTERRSNDLPQFQDIKATYLSIVEIDADTDTAIARLREAAVQWRERGRGSDLYEIVSSKIITRMNPPVKAQAPAKA